MAKPQTLTFGTSCIIMVGDGASPENFSAPCGFTERSVEIKAETATTAIPDCNDGDLPASARSSDPTEPHRTQRHCWRESHGARPTDMRPRMFTPFSLLQRNFALSRKHPKMSYIPSITLPSIIFEKPAASILLPVALGTAVGFSTSRMPDL